MKCVSHRAGLLLVQDQLAFFSSFKVWIDSLETRRGQYQIPFSYFLQSELDQPGRKIIFILVFWRRTEIATRRWANIQYLVPMLHSFPLFLSSFPFSSPLPWIHRIPEYSYFIIVKSMLGTHMYLGLKSSSAHYRNVWVTYPHADVVSLFIKQIY